METAPLKVSPGDVISAANWNKLVEATGIPSLSVGPGLQGFNNNGTSFQLANLPDDYWVGKVVGGGPHGEADFSKSCRYWIERQQLQTINHSPVSCSEDRACNSQQKLPWAAEQAPLGKTIVATNVAEQIGDTHFLPAGSIVLVQEEIDGGLPTEGGDGFPAVRYRFSQTPPPFLGNVVSSGECGEGDFTDERYFVTRQVIDINTGDYTTVIKEDNTSDAADVAPGSCETSPCSPDFSCNEKKDNKHQTIVVTNLAEQANHSHNLKAQTLVQVTWYVGPDNMPRYAMTVPIGPSVGKFCTQADAPLPDCTGATAPVFTNVAKNVTELDFLSDDFLVYQQQHTSGMTTSNCNPGTVLVEWNGMTFTHYVYGEGNVNNCHTKIFEFTDPMGTPPSSPTEVLPSVGPTYNKYGVFWHLSDPQPAPIVQPEECRCSGNLNTYPNSKLDAAIYLDPCSFLPYVSDYTGAINKRFGTIKFDSSFTLSDDMGSGCENVVTVSGGNGSLDVIQTLSGSVVNQCCGTRLLDFDTTYAQPSSTDSSWIGDAILKVPVFTTLDCVTKNDPCDSVDKQTSVLTQYTYFDPCWAYTTWYNCDSTVVTNANKVQFASGFTVTPAGSGCNSLATIGLNLTTSGSVSVSGGSGSVTITPSSSGCVENFDFAFTINPPPGPQGDPGPPGTNGVDGTNGTNGTNGVDGTNGTNGVDGAPGPCPTISGSLTCTTGATPGLVVTDSTDPCSADFAFTLPCPTITSVTGTVTLTDGASPAVIITPNNHDCTTDLEFDFTLPCPVVTMTGTVNLSAGATPALTFTQTDTDNPCAIAMVADLVLPCPTIAWAGTSSVTLTPGASPSVSITDSGTSCNPSPNFAFTLPDCCSYTPATPGNWSGSPTNVHDALDRIASAVAGLLGGPIP